MSIFSTVFAHQGGWDELLFVLAPLVIFAALLFMARRRIADVEANEDEAGEGTDTAP